MLRIHASRRSFLLASTLATTLAGSLIGQCTSTWQSIGTPGTQPNRIFAMVPLANGDLVVGGEFTTANMLPAHNLARWDGTSWHAYGGGFTNNGLPDGVYAVELAANGDLVVGGRFSMADTTAASSIARWDGTTWHAFGSGITIQGLIPGTSFPATISAVLPLANGDLVVGGTFDTAGGTPANSIAIWDGASWSALGAGIQRFGGPGDVGAIAQRANGDLVVGGLFDEAGGVAMQGVAVWNGSSWSELGGGLSGPAAGPIVTTVIERANGDLVVGGGFSAAGGVATDNIAVWDGANWSALGSGVQPVTGLPWVRRLIELPNGQLAAGGIFMSAGGTTTTGFAVFDGSAWSTAGWAAITGGGISSLRLDAEDNLIATGAFSFLPPGSIISIAALVPGCPALQSPFGAGCPSSGGANELTVTQLPWIGATYAAEATGLPALALVVQVYGLSTVALPLALALAQGQPGCTLTVSPDFLQVSLSTTGTSESALALPNSASLVGTKLYHQVAPFELDAQANITAVTVSNSLQLTIGSL